MRGWYPGLGRAQGKPGAWAETSWDPYSTSFWKRLSRLMSKVNPEPNVVHIMGCYILGNPNGEKV